MSHAKISFPERKIRIINADIEIDVDLTDEAFERMTDIFNRQDMDPLIKLTLISPSASAEFTNLNQHHYRD